MQPLVLEPNQPSRFYRGGSRIANFRGLPETGANVPEDWVASATPLFGARDLGLTRLPSGQLLTDAVASDPLAWLGPDHLRRFGRHTELLVKLLDAGERLPIHAHPDRDFAVAHGLDGRHGKSEAWMVLAADNDPVVHLGFSRSVDLSELAGWVSRQEVDAMLQTMHRVPVRAGDTVFVPAGLPHAIGPGILLVEAQEPTDLSVLLEWQGFGIDGLRDGHLGLGLETALRCIDRRAWAPEEIARLHTPSRDGKSSGSLLPAAADPFFRMERWRIAARKTLDAGFSVLVVLAGLGELATSGAAVTPLRAGLTVLTSHATGELELRGSIDVVRCRPPVA